MSMRIREPCPHINYEISLVTTDRDHSSWVASLVSWSPVCSCVKGGFHGAHGTCLDPPLHVIRVQSMYILYVCCTRTFKNSMIVFLQICFFLSGILFYYLSMLERFLEGNKSNIMQWFKNNSFPDGFYYPIVEVTQSLLGTCIIIIIIIMLFSFTFSITLAWVPHTLT